MCEGIRYLWEAGHVRPGVGPHRSEGAAMTLVGQKVTNRGARAVRYASG